MVKGMVKLGLSAFNRMRRLKTEREAQLLVTNEQATVTNDRAYTDYTAQEISDMNAKEQRAFIEQYGLEIEGYKSMKAPELDRALLAALGFGRDAE